MVKVDISRSFVFWVALFIVFLGSGFVYGYNPSGSADPSIMGHSANELEIDGLDVKTYIQQEISKVSSSSDGCPDGYERVVEGKYARCVENSNWGPVECSCSSAQGTHFATFQLRHENGQHQTRITSCYNTGAGSSNVPPRSCSTGWVVGASSCSDGVVTNNDGWGMVTCRASYSIDNNGNSALSGRCLADNLGSICWCDKDGL